MNTTFFYAVVVTLVAFAITLVAYFTGLQSDHIRHFQYVQWVTMAVIFVGLYLGADARRQELPGATLRYGQAFGIVFVIGLLYTLMGTVTGYVHMAFIHPDFSQYLLINAREQMAAQGLSEAQMDAAAGFQAKLLSPVGLVISGLIGGLFLSVVLALLHALALTRRRPLAKLLLIYALILGGVGLVLGGLGGLGKGEFLLGAAKGLAINVAVAVVGWGLLLKLTGYAADAPAPVEEPPM